VKNGDVKRTAVLSGILIDLDSQGVCMAQQENLLWVATTTRNITCYSTRGKVQRRIEILGADVTDLQMMSVRR